MIKMQTVVYFGFC